MRHAIMIERAGGWPVAEAVGAVTLDYDMRQRRRIRLDCGAAGPVLLDLERPAGLRPGDGLRLEEGGWIAVEAAPEDLAEIAATDTAHLLRLAWHLGNRHCPAEIALDRIYVRRDHVIEQMARGLGATVTQILRPFHPEGGAYAAEGHDHG
ncbi:MAG: urease accessory protein [Alphaproteobacteria bacterium]|jgi:urease accessory protein